MSDNDLLDVYEATRRIEALEAEVKALDAQLTAEVEAKIKTRNKSIDWDAIKSSMVKICHFHEGQEYAGNVMCRADVDFVMDAVKRHIEGGK